MYWNTTPQIKTANSGNVRCMFQNTHKIMIHCKTHKCAKNLGRIISCHTGIVMFKKQNAASGYPWSTSALRLFGQSNSHLLPSFALQKIILDIASRVLCLQCPWTWLSFVGMTREFTIIVYMWHIYFYIASFRTLNFARRGDLSGSCFMISVH